MQRVFFKQLIYLMYLRADVANHKRETINTISTIASAPYIIEDKKLSYCSIIYQRDYQPILQVHR